MKLGDSVKKELRKVKSDVLVDHKEDLSKLELWLRSMETKAKEHFDFKACLPELARFLRAVTEELKNN